LAVTSAVVSTGIAVGIVSTAITASEAITGKDMWTGQKLSDDVRSERAGEAVTGFAAIGLSGGKGPVAPTDGDQPMLENLVSTRAGGNPDGSRMSNNATLSQGQTATGDFTPVRQSIPGPNDTPGLTSDHGEPQTMGDLGLKTSGGNKGGPVVVAVDQNPCTTCKPMLQENLPPGSRVIVPENPSKPGSSPKSAAADAADGKIDPTTGQPVQVRPRTVMTIPPENLPSNIPPLVPGSTQPTTRPATPPPTTAPSSSSSEEYNSDSGD
jgi:hypothetical protein